MVQNVPKLDDSEAGEKRPRSKLVGYDNFVRHNPKSDKFDIHRFHHVEFYTADATMTYKRFVYSSYTCAGALLLAQRAVNFVRVPPRHVRPCARARCGIEINVPAHDQRPEHERAMLLTP
jgi:hypothetical protein